MSKSKVPLFLISMPWAYAWAPSIQTGVLKQYLDLHSSNQAEVYDVPAHLVLPARVQRELGPWDDYYAKYEELPYTLLDYACDFRNRLDNKKLSSALKELKSVNKKKLKNLTLKFLKTLRRATDNYLDEVIDSSCAVECNDVIVVGFTLNYDQLYSSLYAAKFIKNRLKDKKVLFVFGGSCTSIPRAMAIIQKSHLEGISVIGEGEQKLKSIMEVCYDKQDLSISDLIKEVVGLSPDIYDSRSPINLEKMDTRKSLMKTQIENFSDISNPDYTAYFEAVVDTCFSNIEELDGIPAKKIMIPFEGSRGCFAKCDFCSLNSTWRGFRKSTAQEIYFNLKGVIQKYEYDFPIKVQFVDNVTDTWAEEYAEIVIKNDSVLPSFMELRAHHNQDFWTKLALSGVESIQVGIEALSPYLLKSMNKGTYTIQNLRVQKWLKELQILSTSNLITHHPKSTVEDVSITRKLAFATMHFGKYQFSYFGVSLGSPIYDELEQRYKDRLEPTRSFYITENLNNEIAFAFLPSNYPEDLMDNEMVSSWDKFCEDYTDELAHFDKESSLKVVKYSGQFSVINDTRGDQQIRYQLNEVETLIYEICHKGLTLDGIQSRVRLPQKTVVSVLNEFIDNNLMVEIEGHYLSLALRDRDVLVNELLEGLRKNDEKRSFVV